MKTIDLLGHINKIKREAPESNSRRFVIIAYNRVIKKLRESFADTADITDKSIDGLPLTNYMKIKLKELIRKPTLRDDTLDITTQLEDIPGIGPKKIKELIKMGLTRIEQLKQHIYFDDLSKSAKLFVEKAPERKIPHAVIKKIDSKIKSKWDTTIVGSYRRIRPVSRDIDLMLISKEPADLANYVEFLRTKLPNLYLYASGPDKASFILGVGSKYYKFDIFRTPPDHKWSMLLYSTGSKEFNIWMRGVAKRQGYLLNQDGIFKNGKRISIKSEKGYFDILKIKYVNPEDREK